MLGSHVWRSRPTVSVLRCRNLWTPGTGYRPRQDDPHRRPVLALREGAEARLRRGHPWVSPRDIKDPEALKAQSPCLVNVQASDGEMLGVALYNAQGTIAARMLSTSAFQRIDADFFADRLRKCLSYRERLFADPYYRLVHAEADGLPGLIIDRYGDQLVVQPNAAGLDTLLWPIADALEEVLKPKVVIIRQDTPGRRKEKASAKREVLKGQYNGPTELRENGVTFAVDLLHGQKTGWYFDHRNNRALLATMAPQTPRVLDLYSYCGGFGVTLAQYGADHVVCVDSSEPALELCRRAAAMNSVGGRVKQVKADALEFLKAEFEQRDSKSHTGEQEKEYDLVIVDPPNLGVDKLTAPKAIRHYEKLILGAARLCASPGLLFVASCTYNVGEKDLMGAASRALGWLGRDYRLISTGSQAADHPGHLGLPESQYLRALLIHLF
ncbi:unnamed protein product [Polarella glacialis]|uniref:S-adenosylmethionine-dependent methyltransferase domain-containing protein n=1 Tax=Polarella glacialis TaxID=89957 RepID=A0A813JRG1_POLGL|nr:unnamed protein product [Polarella glacialis]CAE8682503.1 unnamed protein product [Polarella glacialis]